MGHFIQSLFKDFNVYIHFILATDFYFFPPNNHIKLIHFHFQSIYFTITTRTLDPSFVLVPISRPWNMKHYVTVQKEKP